MDHLTIKLCKIFQKNGKIRDILEEVVSLESKFSKPKGFGELLDHTFSLSKKKFSDFFLILLLLMGPVYVLEAIILLLSGTSFFREVGFGEVWYEQIISSFDDSTVIETTSFGADIAMIFIGLLSLLLFPVAEAAILFAINHIRKNEEYTIKSVIKKGFSKFWPMLGSNILFLLIVIAMFFVSIFVTTLVGIITGIGNPVIGVIIGIIMFLGFTIGFGYLCSRLAFYFCVVVLEDDAPGFSRSWRLSQGRSWILFGLYVIFMIIVSIISAAGELTFGLFLGNSVLFTLITNLLTLFTTLIFSVGYALMYFDSKLRRDADDLKDMIDDYHK